MSKDVNKSMNVGEAPKLESYGESSDGELSMLQCHTKVMITRNNITKSTLVGVQGVVTKAVGLGGWHWLELSNGMKVKLQRNAIAVIEAPPAIEQNSDFDNEDINKKKSYTHFTSPKSTHQDHKSSGSHPRTMKNSTSHHSKAKGSVSAPHGSLKVDLSKLDTPALERYWRYYNLEKSSSSSNPNPTREQLLDAVQKHFVAEEVDEAEVFAGFVKAVNKEKNARK